MVLEEIETGSLKLNLFRFPNTLFIDSSLSSKDIRALLLLRELRICELQTLRRFRRECEITDEDIYKTQVRLKNAYHRFASESGLDLDYWTYCDLYQQVWNCHRSTCYRLFAQDLNYSYGAEI